MLLIKIVCFVIISGLFRQPFANAKSAAVSTLKRLTIDTKNIKKPDIGFSVQKDMPKCTCPDNVDLNEKKPNGEIYYNKLDLTSSFVYCTNCVSIISAPPGYQVEVTKLFVNFYNDSKASLTIRNGRGNDGYVLEK
uniref:Uncharacterized protein n=1 Tax=Plectus sambesii TaxID=2011161 RepID=A0A914VYL3_9BILA